MIKKMENTGQQKAKKKKKNYSPSILQDKRDNS